MANPQPPVNPKPPESHYDPNKTGFIFAIVAIVLLIAVGALVMKDYSREWKDYQKSFRELEVEKTRVKYDKAEKELAKNPEYTALKEELAKAKKEFDASCTSKLASVKKDIAALETQDALINQNYKFAKTQSDVAKFQYEAAMEHHSHNLEKIKAQYLGFDKKTAQLKLKVDDSADALKAKNNLIDACGEKLKVLTKKEATLSKQIGILKRKLGKIDTFEMNFTNQIGNVVRDVPIIDLSNPNYKVQQIVLKDITEDVNFLQVPKVDRCITCHLGIANPDFKKAPQPFTTHPNLELYLGNNSPHPMEEFGCTSCHLGRGRGTSFTTAVHTPANEEEKKRWQKKYHWEEMHHWDEPMLPTQFTESSCFKCHSGQTVIKGAEKLNLGMQLIERAGCYNCHTIDKYKGWAKSGPDLTKLSSKSTKEWAYRWIAEPQSFRPKTWMPSFFNQSNNSDPESVKRSAQEIHAMVAYIFAHQEKYDQTPLPAQGNVKKGEELVASIGCFACHQVDHKPTNATRTKDIVRKQQGPNLIGLGNKTDKQWLFNWLKDPSRYHPETKMPNLRLSDQEAADIAAYLSEDKIDSFTKKVIPAIDETVLNSITMDFLMKTMPEKEAQNDLSKMKLEDKLAFSGEKLIGHYGCYSCHNIKGFENAKPIGADLSEEGSKPADKLDFGFIDIEHSKDAWFEQKLKDPRIFDKEKIKAHTDKLIMPNFHLNDEEAEAITTALLGFVKDKTVANKKKSRTIENQYVEDGQKIIRQLNCQGCHMIEGDGGSIQSNVKEWLIKYENKPEAEAANLVQNSSPPNLHGLGKKVKPDWLFEFIHDPSTTTVRPWIKTRMPTYKLNAEHLNVLIKYFNALDKEDFPFADHVNTDISSDEYKVAEDLFSKLDCSKCHVVGSTMPTGTQDTWAPNLMVAKKKLKPNWIIEWIHGPSKLLPGTKMPAFLDTPESGPEDVLGGDENAQIRVLRNFLMNMTDHPAVQEAPKAEPQASTAPAATATPTPAAKTQ